jgi:hypothetical protein
VEAIRLGTATKPRQTTTQTNLLEESAAASPQTTAERRFASLSQTTAGERNMKKIALAARPQAIKGAFVASYRSASLTRPARERSC